MALYTIPTVNQILQNLLNEYRAITTYYGYNINVDPGSEVYLRYSALATQMGVFAQMANDLVNSKMIDTASGTDLDRVGADFGLIRKSATPANGFVQLSAGTSQTLIIGTLLTGPNGLQYQVSQTSLYAPNANVPVVSVASGSQANLAVSSIMTWASPQPNMASIS